MFPCHFPWLCPLYFMMLLHVRCVFVRQHYIAYCRPCHIAPRMILHLLPQRVLCSFRTVHISYCTPYCTSYYLSYVLQATRAASPTDPRITLYLVHIACTIASRTHRTAPPFILVSCTRKYFNMSLYLRCYRLSSYFCPVFHKKFL